jgi:hypothetical protein
VVHVAPVGGDVMIRDLIAVVAMILLSGGSIVTGAEFEQEVKAVTRWVRRKLARIVPAPEIGAFGRRMPSGVETVAAAGGAPGATGARLSPGVPGEVRAALDDAPGPEPWQHGQQKAPRHALPPAVAPRVDLTRPAVYVQTPDKPPWETDTAAQPVLDDKAIAAIEASRVPARLAITGAPGGCTGTTQPVRALGLADLGPGDTQGRTLAERVIA